MDPATDDYSTIHAEETMQAAGLIRSYIMGAVYEKLVYPDPASEASVDYQKTLKPLLQKMIASNDSISRTVAFWETEILNQALLL